MRLPAHLLLVPLALLGSVACELDGTGRGLDTSVNGCAAGSEQVETAMVISSLQVNQVTLAAVHVPNKVYDDLGPSGCYETATGVTTWIIESGGEPVGTFEMLIDNPTEGNIDLQNYNDYFRFVWFSEGTAGTGQTYTRFGNFDFVTGSWVVNSTDPLQVGILGSANDNGGGLMDVNMTAEVRLP